MPSSTSSSELRRPPPGRWRATWLGALALAACSLGLLEQLSRARGQRPSVVDDPVLWSFARRDVGDRPSTVALLGASRMALAYSPRAFAEAAPELRAVQLAINGNLPLTVLADLADDDGFHGVAVVDLIEPEIADPLLATDSQAYVARYHALWRAPGALANRYLASLAQSEFAVLAIGGSRIVRSLLGSRRWPGPAWVASDRDRVSSADFTLATRATLAQRAERRLAQLPHAPPPAAWLAIVDRELAPLVARIRARGGDVVIVHLPISGGLAARVDAEYPRAAYWDQLAAHSGARTIHFRDVPAMAHLVCPDEMHLDERDQATFTRALVGALRAAGVLSGREAQRGPSSSWSAPGRRSAQ
ncbi:MAG TPA: hypothetical protein VLX92_33290 [Kofleriaceae bacterium]|nr:hypothetical protein [Kofleriaceae bacterium]